MQELLAPAAGGGGSSSGSNDLEARLYAADLHGCLIRVVQTAGGPATWLELKGTGWVGGGRGGRRKGVLA